jgi:oligogalacturonide lyase
MIGRKWDSEIKIFKDRKTGRQIKQLTSRFNNIHLYFTENCFDIKKNEIIFYSDRTSVPDADKSLYHLFRLNIDTGEMIQLTSENEQIDNITKTPDSSLIVYISGSKKIKMLDTASGINKVIYEEKGNFKLSNPSISGNKARIGFCRNENVKINRGPNYSGFKDTYYSTKDGRITLLSLEDLSFLDIFRDTQWVNHFQFCPIDSDLGMFCHEGPWNLVTQRIWFIDFMSREVRPCFRQSENDSIGHEFWTQEGCIFFDNRGPGHDGTITSHHTQAVATNIGVRQNIMIPCIGLVDKFGTLIKKLDMPFYCNHYHSNPAGTKLVGDDVDDIVIIDISGEKAELEVLCSHNTSWLSKKSHCHPTWSWDGSKILYASDSSGNINLYLVEV